MNALDAAAAVYWGAGTAFRGADYTRLSADRMSSASPPNAELGPALRTLRARSRDLVRNNPYAAGVVEAFADNIIGEHGILLKPQYTTPPNSPEGKLVKPVNWRIERAWEDWGADYATVDGIESWLETERLIAKSWAQDGEVFLRKWAGWDNPSAFAVQVIDPDHLDETLNVPADRNNGREIVMGIERDEYGRRFAYHFWDRHPDESGRKRVRVPADEVIHYFGRYRPGQERGYPLFAPVLTTVEMVDGYSEAELVAARYHASKMGFITNDSPEAMAAYAVRLSAQNAQGVQDQPRYEKIRHGMLKELAPGQGFEAFDPTHPADAFDPFLKVMLRGVARGLSVSYHTLTGDTADANYSSQRIGLVPERDHWRVIQGVFARRVHRHVYRAWLPMALLSGFLTGMPSRRPADFHRVAWRGRRWAWIDPLNDIQAAEREVKLGLNSRQRLAADRGRDFEVVVDECAEDQAYAREQSVFVGGTDAPPPMAPRPAPSTNGNGAAPSPNGNGAQNRIAEVIR